MEKKGERVTLKEETALYMEMETGELSLKNPEAEEDWEMYKSTTTEKVAYFCQQNGEWNGPRETTKPKEKEKRAQKITIQNKSQTQGQAERSETGGALSYPIADGSEHLLWTLRFEVEDWLLGGKWKDFYLLEEVINIPPLLEMGMEEEEAAWQTAVRDTKRYEVAVLQGKRLVKARYRVPKRNQKQREKKRRTELSEVAKAREIT